MNDCTRSHPHENMNAMCELRTEIARLTNQLARSKRERIVFPTMLRQMWSGGDVQAWLDENVNNLKPCRSPYCECDVGKCTHPGFYDMRHDHGIKEQQCSKQS